MTPIQHVFVGAFVWAVGLCVGSFLNVVIYRLPRGIRLTQPRWSFCPHCRRTLAWRDNLPVWAWFALRGRCRTCRAPISVQYPVVEALTGAAFSVVYVLLFVVEARPGVSTPTLPTHAPLLIAWLLLMSGMIVCSATDLVAYVVDTRVTNFVAAGGCVLYALQPGRELFGTASPLALAAVAACGLTLIVLLWPTRQPEPDEPEPDQTAPSAPASTQWLAITATLLLVISTVALLAAPLLDSHTSDGVIRGALVAVIGLFFLTMVWVGGQEREADETLAAELEAEQPAARLTVLRELVWLAPIIGVGVLGGVAAALAPSAWAAAFGLGWSTWQPIAGLSYAAIGLTIGAAAGWALRIVFTLAFGREAFGVGDIFILAAAGATAGWDLTLLGLAFAVVLALAGWIVGLVLKRASMIPFGPWLGLGFLVALWMGKPAHAVVGAYVADVQNAWRVNPGLIIIGAGVLLVGGVLSVTLSRVLRRVIGTDQP